MLLMEVMFAPMERARPAVEDFSGAVANRFGDRLNRIVLFGSLARGTYSIESDVDLALVMPKYDLDTIYAIYDLAGQYMTEKNIFISMKIFTAEQFDAIARDRTGFYREIEKDGIVLWTRPN